MVINSVVAAWNYVHQGLLPQENSRQTYVSVGEIVARKIFPRAFFFRESEYGFGITVGAQSIAHLAQNYAN